MATKERTFKHINTSLYSIRYNYILYIYLYIYIYIYIAPYIIRKRFISEVWTWKILLIRPFAYQDHWSVDDCGFSFEMENWLPTSRWKVPTPLGSIMRRICKRFEFITGRSDYSINQSINQNLYSAPSRYLLRSLMTTFSFFLRQLNYYNVIGNSGGVMWEISDGDIGSWRRSAATREWRVKLEGRQRRPVRALCDAYM